MAMLLRSVCLPCMQNPGSCNGSWNDVRWSSIGGLAFYPDVPRARSHRKMLMHHCKFIRHHHDLICSSPKVLRTISCEMIKKDSAPRRSNWFPVTNTRNPFKQQFIKLTAVVAATFLFVSSAHSIDALKTCSCLLKECRLELAKCITNPACAANVACLQTCNDRPDETECQIKCGDLFENSVVDEFNECAVSRKKCVPMKSDVGEFPVPDPSALVKSFNIADFNGKWYITSGLNPTFDAFDCQLHEFHVESGKLVGNISWRIRTPDSGFFTRSAVQKFVQDPNQPGILYNHDNEYLHYQDDWYIYLNALYTLALSAKIRNTVCD